MPSYNRHGFLAAQLFIFSVGGIIIGVVGYGMIPHLGRSGWRYYLIVAACPVGTKSKSITFVKFLFLQLLFYTVRMFKMVVFVRAFECQLYMHTLTLLRTIYGDKCILVNNRY